MKAQQASIIASSIGIVLVLVSMLLATGIIPTTAAWDNEDAEGFIESSVTYHKASFDKDATEQEVEELARAYEERRAALDKAIDRKSAVPKYVRYGGYGFLVVGFVFYIVGKVQDPDQ